MMIQILRDENRDTLAPLCCHRALALAVPADHRHAFHVDSRENDRAFPENQNAVDVRSFADRSLDAAFRTSKVCGKLLDTGRRKFGSIIGENVHTGIHTSIYPGRKICFPKEEQVRSSILLQIFASAGAGLAGMALSGTLIHWTMKINPSEPMAGFHAYFALSLVKKLNQGEKQRIRIADSVCALYDED